MRRRKRLLSLLVILISGAAVALALAAPPGDPARAGEERFTVPRVPNALVGKVSGTEAYIALSYDGSRLRAYACDGSARRQPTISRWFEGAWDGRTPVTIARGGSELRIDRVVPRTRIDGRLDGRRFTVVPATGPAGLYDRAAGERRDTWIVLGHGGVRGVIVDPRPRKCRPVFATLADGTTQLVTVCKVG